MLSMRTSRFLAVLGCAAAVFVLGLAALLGAFGGGGSAISAVATTTSTTRVTVYLVGPNTENRYVAVPDVIGESQAQATQTLAAAGLGTSASFVDNNDGAPSGTVVTESPWQGSMVGPGSLISIKVVS
jgi:beta-lactam-binding protein with PASTA domain